MKICNTTLEAKIADHEKSLQSKTKEINSLAKDNERLSKEVESAKGKFIDLGCQRTIHDNEDLTLTSQLYLISDKSKEKAITNGVHNGDEKEHDLK